MTYLDDHERRRRIATSAVIDMVCQCWPAQAHLRDEGDHMRRLREQRKATSDEAERDRLSDAIADSCERMCALIDVLAEQMPP
jgi:hypothetical protein